MTRAVEVGDVTVFTHVTAKFDTLLLHPRDWTVAVLQ